MLHIGAGVPSNSTSVKRGQRGLLFLVTRASGTNLKWAGKWSTLGANGMVKVELSRIACESEVKLFREQQDFINKVKDKRARVQSRCLRVKWESSEDLSPCGHRDSLQ